MVIRGRPRNAEREQEVRGKLLASAKAMLVELNYKDISIRDLARRAGVNSAMISYHFGSKEALFVEVIQQLLDGTERRGGNNGTPDASSATAEELLHQVVRRFVSMHRRHPWFARLLIDQVMMREGKLGDLFVEQVVRPQGSQLLTLIETLQAQGKLRSGLDPMALRASLLGLSMFPFMALPLLKQAFAFDVHEQDMKGWIEYTADMFLHGAGEGIEHGSVSNSIQ